MILQGDEREAPGGLAAEIAGRVNRNAGGHGAEQGQEKAGQRIDSQMERQVRKTQREHQLRGRQPYRLQAERRQGEAR